jgi:hypothetical protein
MDKTIHNTDLDKIAYPPPEGMKPVLWLTSPPHNPEASDNSVNENDGSNNS